MGLMTKYHQRAHQISDLGGLFEEDIQVAQFERAEAIILKFLFKKVGRHFIRLGGPDFYVRYQQGNDKGIGIRYLIKGSQPLASIRLNWSDKKKSSREVSSVDFFYKRQDKPTFRLLTQGLSLVKVLPVVADLLVNRTIPKESIPVITDTKKAQPSELLQEHRLFEEARFKANIELPPPSDIDQIMDISSGTDRVMALAIRGFNVAEVMEYAHVSQDIAWRGFRMVKAKYGSKAEPDARGRILTLLDTQPGRADKEDTPNSDYNENAFLKYLKGAEDPLKEAFAELEANMTVLLSGHASSLIVTGVAGVGKTFQIKKILTSKGMDEGADYAYYQGGSVTPRTLYETLWRNRSEGRVLIFDDIVGLFSDEKSFAILKGALDNKQTRQVAWLSSSPDFTEYSVADSDLEAAVEADTRYGKNGQVIREGRYPRKFNYYGRIIIISNEDPTKIDGAIKSRSLFVNMWVPVKDVIKYMHGIIPIMKFDGLNVTDADKNEVMEFFDEIAPGLPTNAKVDFRILEKAMIFKKTTGLDWRQYISKQIMQNAG